MIELRWLEFEVLVSDGRIGGGVYASKDRKLQYRTIDNFLEYGLQQPIWSDWMDVTTETLRTMVKEN